MNTPREMLRNTVAESVLELIEQRVKALGHRSVEDLLCTLEHNMTREEIAAEAAAGQDAKRFRMIAKSLEDWRMMSLLNSEFGDQPAPTSGQEFRDNCDRAIATLEAAGYEI